MIVRGTNPPLTMKLKTRTGQDVDTAILTDGRITFKQNGRTVLEKKLKDCTLSGSSIIIELSQRDTLCLDDKIPVRIQGKFMSLSGRVIPTKTKSVSVGEIFNEEVL